MHFENLPPNTRIKIVDNYGNMIKDYQDVVDNKISISSLNSGMYFVHFKNNNSVLSYGKFVKTR
ncbi:MAG: T9SS type A sorting domain-containing protein [Bacteroidetes bacterium]|nr:T9SS type A sorting domain-containing protein [Bacteroidota bacterium]